MITEARACTHLHPHPSHPNRTIRPRSPLRRSPGVNWVLDADIREFFSNLDHRWLGKFLEHRIADRRVLRLIGKWLSAGVIEKGEWSETEGAPQGASASPLLANVYLHYVFDLWVQ